MSERINGKQGAEILGISLRGFYQAMHREQIHSTKDGYLLSDVERLKYTRDNKDMVKDNTEYPIVYPELKTDGNKTCRKCLAPNKRLFQGNMCADCVYELELA